MPATTLPNLGVVEPVDTDQRNLLIITDKQSSIDPDWLQRINWEEHKFTSFAVEENLDDAALLSLIAREYDEPQFIVRSGVDIIRNWVECLHKASLADDYSIISACSLNCNELYPFNNTVDPDGAIEQLTRYAYLFGDRCLIPCRSINWDACWISRDCLSLVREKQNTHLFTQSLNTAIVDHLITRDPAKAITHDTQTSQALHPMEKLRHVEASNLDHLQAAGFDSKPVLLHITHSWGGGTRRWLQDLIKADTHHCHLVLSSKGQWDQTEFGQCMELSAGGNLDAQIARWYLPVPIASTDPHNATYTDILERIIDTFSVDALIISSLIGHSLDCLNRDKKTCIVFHDYYPILPNLNPATTDSATFLYFQDKTQAQWDALKESYCARLSSGSILMASPSNSVRETLYQLAPALSDLPITVIGNGLAPWKHESKLQQKTSTRLKLVIPGRLTLSKGSQLLKKCLPLLRQFADVYLLGCGKDGYEFFSCPNVHIIIDYQRDELPDLLQSIEPDAAMLLSTVAETFSYTLSEMWSLGLPVIASNLGSFAERIDNGRNGILFDPSDPQSLGSTLQSLNRNRKLLASLWEGVAQTPLESTRDMADRYAQWINLDEKPALSYCMKPIPLDQIIIADNWKSIHQLRQQKLEKAAEIIALKSEVDKRGEWGHDLNHQLKEQNLWAISLDKKLRETQDDYQSLDTTKNLQINELLANLDERTEWALNLNRELEASQQYAQQIQSEKHEILSSSSWLITKPLRFTARKCRHIIYILRYKLSRSIHALSRAKHSLFSRGIEDTLSRIQDKQHTQEQEEEPAVESHRQYTIPDISTPFSLPQSARPIVSIIIPVFNHYSMTLACLKSIADEYCGTPIEIIVVDDCSSDETTKIADAVNNLILSRNTINSGFIHSCNQGALVAQGEYLVFLNNDTIVKRRWLTALLACFLENPLCGVAGSKLVYPDGKLQEAGGIIFDDASGWNYGHLADPDEPRFNYRRPVDYCSGACIMLRKSHFDSLGGFDTYYAPAYYEDTDLAFKTRKAGLQVIYQPRSCVIHFEGISSGLDVNSGTKHFQQINNEKFVSRWQKELSYHPKNDPDRVEVAKDHRVKGRILIVDACTPAADQDSGSVRIINLMQLLIQMGYKVTFMPENLLYDAKYTTRLQDYGIEVIYGPYYKAPAIYLEEQGQQLNFVFLSRHYVAAPLIADIRQHCNDALIIFDTVDLHYLREERLADLEKRDILYKIAAKTKINELSVISKSDLTLVVSPLEKNLLAKAAPNARVEILSNIHEVYGCRKSFSKRKDIMFIGGYQHPPNVDAVNWFCKEIFPQVQQQIEGIAFHIIGSKAPQSVIDLGSLEGVTYHGFVNDITPFLDGCRIAVAPLRYGAGVKGKVNMSMSYGQAVVATTPAVEGMHATSGVDVLVANRADEFAASIVTLYSDEILWQTLSDNGLNNVQTHFSMDAAELALQKILA